MTFYSCLKATIALIRSIKRGKQFPLRSHKDRSAQSQPWKKGGTIIKGETSEAICPEDMHEAIQGKKWQLKPTDHQSTFVNKTIKLG